MNGENMGGGSGSEYTRRHNSAASFIKELEDIMSGLNPDEIRTMKRYDLRRKICNYVAAGGITLGVLVTGYGKIKLDRLENKVPAEISLQGTARVRLSNAEIAYESMSNEDPALAADKDWNALQLEKIAALKDEEARYAAVSHDYEMQKRKASTTELLGISIGLALGGLFYGLKSIYESRRDAVYRSKVKKASSMRVV